LAPSNPKPRYLVAGQYYYMAALMKEGGGLDNLAVGWQRPSGLMQRPMPANTFRLSAGGDALNVSDPSASGSPPTPSAFWTLPA
jgi:hypothetical protein